MIDNLSTRQLAEIRKRHNEYRTHLCIAIHDRQALLDHITALETEKSELVALLNEPLPPIGNSDYLKGWKDACVYGLQSLSKQEQGA